MFVILGDITFDILPEGEFRKRRLDPDAARDAIAGAQAAVIGCFEFGAVPSVRRETLFRDLLAALDDRHDISLDPSIFFSQVAPDEETDCETQDVSFPIPPQLAHLSQEHPILVVSYGFEMGEADPDATGVDRLRSRIRLCPETVIFHLLECVPPLRQDLREAPGQAVAADRGF